MTNLELIRKPLLEQALTSSLRIRGVELLVHLGWEDSERDQQQVVLVDIDIRFSELPKACVSDELTDTFCYAELINSLRRQLINRPFHLVEHLTAEIYSLVKSQLMSVNTSSVRISLTKHPSVEGLTGGVCFSYGDSS